MSTKKQPEKKQPKKVIVPNKDLGIDWHKKGPQQAPKGKDTTTN